MMTMAVLCGLLSTNVHASSILSLPVGKVLMTEVEPLSRNSTVRDVLNRFREGGDIIVIVDQARLVCGIITPYNIGRVVDAFKKNQDTPVTDVMTHDPYWAYESEPIEQVVTMMNKMGLSAVPIVETKSRKYLGIVRKSQIAQVVDNVIWSLRMDDRPGFY